MDHATSTALLLATHFATSLFPLTVRLIPVITQIGRLIVRFRRAELTPQSLPPVRDPVARSTSRTGPDHCRMDVQSPRAARPSGISRSATSRRPLA